MRNETVTGVLLGNLNTREQASGFYREMLRRSIKEEIKNRLESGANRGNVSAEFSEASINQIFSKEVFEANIPEWVARFNELKHASIVDWKDQTFDQLKNTEEFLDYVKNIAMAEMKLNFEASIVVSSENVLDEILGINDQHQDEALLKKRNEVAQAVLDFTSINQSALTEYNSISNEEFFAKYGIKKEAFEKSFQKIFSEKGIDVSKEQGRIDGLFNDVRFLCEELYVNTVKLEKGYKKMIEKAFGNSEEWQKALKEGEEEAKKTISESNTTAILSSYNQSSGRLSESTSTTSYSPSGSYAGTFEVQAGKLRIDALEKLGYSDFHPDVKIRSIENGKMLFEINDEYGDSEGLKRLCSVEELPYLTTKLALDFMLNQGIVGKSGEPISVTKLPGDINLVLTDPIMIRMAKNLLRPSGPLIERDYRMIRNLYVIILNNDAAFPNVSDRVTQMDAFLTNSGSSGHLYKVLNENIDNVSLIKSLTVSKLISREV